MGFMNKLFHSTKKTDTPNTSTTTSPSGSIVNVDAYIKPTHDKYYNDPMRISKKPDTVGGFWDPMGGSRTYSVSRDVTNTGA